MDSAACDQALRKTAPLAGETRTSAGRPGWWWGEQGCVATGGREPAEVADSDFVSQPLRDVNPQTLESLTGITTAKAAQSPGQRRPTARRAVE